MKKALLIAAATLAAGVVSSQAQVYSQNIVGYVNVPLNAGFNTVGIPLDASAGNGLTNLLQNTLSAGPGTGALDGDYVYIFTGSSFVTYTIDSTQPTGFADATDTTAVSAPVINPGQAFYYDNVGAAKTNTFVGSVHISSLPGTATNVLSGTQTYTFVGSVLPVGGGVSSTLGLTNVLSAGPGTGDLDGDYIYRPNISGGSVHGYTVVTIDSTQTTGFADATDTTAVAEPQIPVGSGFLFNNALSATKNWIQSLNP
jgi:hypothetical protein